jgi:hypothetical protein
MIFSHSSKEWLLFLVFGTFGYSKKPCVCFPRTGWESNGLWWMWIVRDKLLVNGHCRRRSHCLLLTVVLIRCARRAIRDARGEKWCAPAPSSSKRIRTSFSAPSADQHAERINIRINNREWRMDAERLDRILEQARRAASEGIAGALDAVEQTLSNLHIPVSPETPSPPAPPSGDAVPGMPTRLHRLRH